MDGSLADTEFGRHFRRRQKSGFPQPLIAALEAIAAPDVSDQAVVETAAFAGAQATIVELRGDLGLRVLVQQAVDFRNDRSIGLPRFTGVSSARAR